MPENDTFNQILPTLPLELHQPFSDLANEVGLLLQEFADTYNPRPGYVGLIMAYMAARTIADTASGMVRNGLPEGEAPRLKEVQACAHEMLNLTSSMVVMLHGDDVQDGLIEDRACTCAACQLRKKLEAGELTNPDEIVDTLRAMITEKRSKAKNAQPTPEPEHVTGTPSQSSPWYVGLGSEEQVLGSPLQVSPGEDQPSPAGGDSSDGKGRLATD